LQIAEKMINSFEIKWLTGVTESISKHKSLHNRVIKESKQEEDRENTNDYIRSNERIHYIDDW
jgi:hypothetical protein